MALQGLGTATLRKIALVSLAAIGLSGTAHADDVNCPPELGAVTIDGNVLIAAACTMDGTTVTGNVLLYSGGSLVARGLDVEGNIQADGADYVDIIESRVDGSIQLEGLVGDASNITSNTVNGNIQLDSNRSRLEVLDNAVGADIQAFANVGGVVIADNVVDGNLQCKDNDPAPVGGNNQVSGNMEGQCANLQSGSGGGSGGSGGGSQGDGSGSDAAAASSGGGSFSLLSLAGLLSLALMTAAARKAHASFAVAPISFKVRSDGTQAISTVATFNRGESQ